MPFRWGIPMIAKVRCFVFASMGTAATLVLGAVAGGCSSDRATPAEAEVHDAGVARVDVHEAGLHLGDTGARGQAGGLKLTWRVVELKPLGGYVGGDSGAHRGAGADAGAPSSSSAGPVEGMKVCVLEDESNPCAMTDADGRFTIAGLPAMSDVTLSFEKQGYLPTLLPVETGSTDMDGSVAGSLTIPGATLDPSSVPVAVDSSKGIVATFAVTTSGTGAIGARPTLTPESGNGPYFVTAQNVLDVSADSFVDKTAIYFNVAPGTYEVAFDEPQHDCAPATIPFGFGFAAGPSSVKVPVIAGYETICGVLCTPSSAIVKTGN